MKVRSILNPLLPYAVSISASLICLFFVKQIGMRYGDVHPFILFLPSIIFSAWYGGIRGGVFSSFISSLLLYYYYILPFQSAPNYLDGSMIDLIFYILISLFISYIIETSGLQDRLVHYKKKEYELNRKIKRLEEQLTIAKQEIESRDEFLSIASHELKTPLTTVLLQIQSTLHNIQSVSLAEFSVENLLSM